MQKTIRNLLLIAITLFVCNIGKVDALATGAHCVYEVPLNEKALKVTIDVFSDGSIKVDPGLSYQIAGITMIVQDFINEYYFNYHNFVTDDKLMVCPNSIYIQSEEYVYTSQNNQLEDEETPETSTKKVYTKLSYYVDKNEMNQSKGFAEGTLLEKQSESFTSEEGTLTRYDNMCRYNDIFLFYGHGRLSVKTIYKTISDVNNKWNPIEKEIYKAFQYGDLPDTCPEAIYIAGNDLTNSVEVYLNSRWDLKKVELSSSKVSSASELGFNGNVSINPSDQDIGYENCALLGAEDGPLRTMVKWIINLAYIAVPLLIVILTIVDFSSTVLSGEEKNFKAAGTKFVKRLVIGVAIIFLPMLLTFIIDLSGVLGPVTKNQLFCSIFQ